MKQRLQRQQGQHGQQEQAALAVSSLSFDSGAEAAWKEKQIAPVAWKKV